VPSKSPCAAIAVLLLGGIPAAASAKPLFVEPDDAPDPRGLTLSGYGLARVEPPERRSERSIQRAVDAARPAAAARAMRDAQRRARTVALAAGLTLGEVQAVRARVPDTGLFGPSRHCRRVRARAGDLPGRRLRCVVPALATATLRVTFATAETSAVAAAGRAIVASGSGSAPVRPRSQTSPSIRAALRRARLSADPEALAAALQSSTESARAAGLQPGPLFSIAEEPRPPFSPDIVSGAFGPGRFCGTIRRFSFRRGPDGERRRVRGPRVRRCYVPGMSSLIRVTRVAG
jgi:uncharacterized protein YggE